MAAFVRGKTIDDAFKQLQFLNVKGARVMEEVLREAQEAALADHAFEFRSDMWVAEALTERSKIIKSMRRHWAKRGVTAINHKYVWVGP